MSKFNVKEYILATRPWSFTAAIIPIVITTALVDHPFLSLNFVRALTMGVSVQAGANLSNTYYDFIKGVDKNTDDCGDRTLVDRKVSENGIKIFFVLCYSIAVLTVLPELFTTNAFIIFISGLLLAYFYTATPIGLKYQALGDLTIFICFGPLLMQGVSYMLTGSANELLYMYSIPIGLITENILHANNARDIITDTDAGITTLANLVGRDFSYYLYGIFFFLSYVAIGYVSFYHHWGCLLTFLTIPLTLNLCKMYINGYFTALPEETAKMHLVFGVLMFLGIYFTRHGVETILTAM